MDKICDEKTHFSNSFAVWDYTGLVWWNWYLEPICFNELLVPWKKNV